MTGTPPRATLPYDVVDVFTDRAYAGNPLAVVLDAEAPTTAQLQALATDEAPAGVHVHTLPVSAPVETPRDAGVADGAPPLRGDAPLLVRARAFAGDLGIAEDPATGSAALGLAAALVAAGALPGDGVSTPPDPPGRGDGSAVAAAGHGRRRRRGGRGVPGGR